MWSFLVDAVLLAALVLTSLRVACMLREIRQLRALQAEHQAVFDRTTDALAAIRGTVREINRDGAQTLMALELRIDEARALIAELASRGAARGRDASARTVPASRAA